MKRFKFVIIGAGPTGLGAAYRLKELGVSDFLVLEKSNHAGGLAASFQDDNGFTWDIGGHVQFSHYRYFDQLMREALGESGWLTHQRESWAWMRESFVPYPVQNNIRYLPKEVMWKCLDGLISANQGVGNTQPIANFHEWILRVFGEGLAQEFMVPYNFKVWAFPPSMMSYGWIGERVAITDLKRVTKNILFDLDDFSWGPNNTFQFPKQGGTGAIWQAVAEKVGKERIALNSDVVEIDSKRRMIFLKSGDSIEYEYLLSTMPIDLLCRMLQKDLDPEIPEAAAQLKHSSSNIIGVGLKGLPPSSLKTKCWMYFPESNCPFYRVTVFSNYSPSNVPDSQQNWSLMAEVSESSHKPVNRERLIEDTIEGMINTKLIRSKSEVISTWKYSADYGYPTPSMERDQILNRVSPTLEKMGVFSRGRFGAWKYEVSNQDHSLMQGVEWVNWMVLGIPEVTVRFPGMANANWGRDFDFSRI